MAMALEADKEVQVGARIVVEAGRIAEREVEHSYLVEAELGSQIGCIVQ
jgi:hypothetical protein